jgi:hypothetical protein
VAQVSNRKLQVPFSTGAILTIERFATSLIVSIIGVAPPTAEL